MILDDTNNGDRADWALSALRGFVQETRVDTAQDAITDLISDLLHLARARNLDTKLIVANAAGMMDQEVREDSEGNMALVQQEFRTLLPNDR